MKSYTESYKKTSFFPIIALLALSCTDQGSRTWAYSLSSRSMFMSSSVPKKGCAAKPYEKKKVAVFGAGGYLGATTFGFLQRASNIYGTGIAGYSSPRAVCATAQSSGELNKILSNSFHLAFAGEDMVALSNMKEIESIQRSLKGMDAAILGTNYQLEVRPVTSGTYEKSPNDKTLEFYLDERRGVTWQLVENDLDKDLSMFQNSVTGCKLANIKHLIVIQTTPLQNIKEYATALKESGVTFTFISCCANLETTKGFDFQTGLQDDLGLNAVQGNIDEDTWVQLCGEGDKASAPTVARESIAALAVQSLMSLDWDKSRILKVTTAAELKEEDKVKLPRNPQFDRVWCLNSACLEAKLATVE